eukprot:TRINITY_DN3611_c0_g1_i1.p1 TRINITY_DN3611_c0_g1~~TRINITY_DN3611_c0_g1_i1.p1  ORF type:complete len:308 (+),score=58.81 TRINITY_DN3611_c0_g1_i1:50-973(+)
MHKTVGNLLRVHQSTSSTTFQRILVTKPSTIRTHQPQAQDLFWASKRCNSTAVPTSASSKSKLRIAAAAIVERVPVVLPEIPEWEIEYMRFTEKRNAVYDKEQAAAAQKRVDEEMKIRAKKEKGAKKKADTKTEGPSGKQKGQKGEDEGEDKIEDIVYPRITDADKRNDRKSLYRALENRLYLIVKKPREEHAWSFPQGGYEPTADGNHLRNTAQRELSEECGSLMNTFFIGNAPVGSYTYKIPSTLQEKYGNSQKTRVFFYKARYLMGPIRLNKNELEDHLWVTKSELKEYLAPEYYEYVKDLLMD